MNPQAWIGLASLTGFVLVQTAGIAFLLGGLFARTKALEARPHDGDCASQLAAMTATLKAFEVTVSDLKQDIHSIRNALMTQAKASSRRAAP